MEEMTGVCVLERGGVWSDDVSVEIKPGGKDRKDGFEGLELICKRSLGGRRRGSAGSSSSLFDG